MFPLTDRADGVQTAAGLPFDQKEKGFIDMQARIKNRKTVSGIQGIHLVGQSRHGPVSGIPAEHIGVERSGILLNTVAFDTNPSSG